MKYAPVVLFVYKRADKAKKCLYSLEQNSICECSDLFIFCDGSKNEKDYYLVKETQEYIFSYVERSRFKSTKVIVSDRNKGLANSVIEGVTQVVNEYGRVIVIEDDLIVASEFLNYMNNSLDYFNNDENIGAISGYSYPIKYPKNFSHDVYFLKKGDCWGWATWANRWNSAKWCDVDFIEYVKDIKLRLQFEKCERGWDHLMIMQMRNQIDSWAIRWVYNLFVRSEYTVYPKSSLVSNGGFDATGTHCDENSNYLNELNNEKCPQLEHLYDNKVIARRVARYPRQNSFLYYYGMIKEIFADKKC